MLQCDGAPSAQGAGPLGVDYRRLYECSLGGDDGGLVLRCLFLLSLLCWNVALIHLLGSTAGNYLSPTLGKICERLNLSYNVAGVTFLAFGNGAPDVFSSIASFLGGEDAPMIGLNALLGGSMFVCTVVVGSIAILSPCELSARVFLRDVGFHMVAVSAVAVIAAQQDVTLPMAASLFAIYLSYVATVLGSSWYEQRVAAASAQALVSTAIVPGSEPVALGSSLQTAFWHGRASPGPKSDSAAAQPLPPSSPSSSSSSSTVPAPYTFLILDEDGEDRGAEEGDDDRTITLSGGLISPAFSGTIIEDYYSAGAASSSSSSSSSASSSSSSSSSRRESKSGRDPWSNMTVQPQPAPSLWPSWGASPLRVKLLPEEDCDLEMETLGGPEGERGRGASFGSMWNGADGRMSARPGSGGLGALYWQQWLLQRRIRKDVLSSEFWNSSSAWQRALIVLEFPAVLMRDMSIPTLQPESWSKVHAVLHPLVAPLVLLLALGDVNQRVHGLPVPVLSLLLGAPAAVLVLLVTHHSRPPQGRLLATTWVLAAFFMCVTWVYLLASELVVCLETLGEILRIPSAYLGLTVLAWGNSIGDFFSNTSLARRGLGEMAVAGCYGGPVFNVLIGLGLSTSYACLASYPAPFRISLDPAAIVSLVFLYVALGSTCIIVAWCRFRLERPTGFFLVALYVLYSLVQGALVVL